MVLFELLLLAVLLAPAVPEIAAAFFTLLLTLGLILIVPTVLISIIFILPFIVFICVVVNGINSIGQFATVYWVRSLTNYS